jgi:exopolysaccharide biosynthesis polyprenyl glycosylphosphotransferase
MATIPNRVQESLSVPLSMPMVTEEEVMVRALNASTAGGSVALMPLAAAHGEARPWWELPRRASTRLAPVAADLLFATANGCVAFYFSLGSHFGNSLHEAHQLLALLMLYTAVTVLCCHSFGLYGLRGHSSAEAAAIAKAAGLAALLFGAFVAWSGQPLSLTAIACMGALNVTSFAAWRVLDRQMAVHRVDSGKMRNVLIVGANSCGQELARSISANPHWGFVVRGFLDDQAHSNGIRVAGKLNQLAEIARSEYIDDIFIAPPYERSLVWRLTDEARRNHWNVKVLPEFWEPALVQPQVELLGELPVFSLHREPIPAFALCFKRTLDILAVVCAAPILILLVSALAILVKLDSRGPAFYCAQRIGRKGRRFCCWKLRTMVANADELKEELRAKNQRSGPFFKLSFDPRITRLGRFLRKSSLDELPQLWNVLCGDMSLVGPRPHPVDDYQLYDLEHRRRLEVRPGITGLWQVKARRDPSFETNMALDLTYIENWSLLLDFKILLLTVPAVLKGTGQ